MYEMKTAADTLRMLETDKDKGLTRREAMERRQNTGLTGWKVRSRRAWGR